jgi:hypothetical protein
MSEGSDNKTGPRQGLGDPAVSPALQPLRGEEVPPLAHYDDERCGPFPLERAVDGSRKREWTAIAGTEEAVVREMARCLAEISAGRVPK